MNNLCSILKDLSTEATTWLCDQTGVKEETLTDWLLYQLSKRSDRVAYLAFTRHEEAKTTGADWEWVFCYDDGTVTLRMQAKKLFEDQDNYPGLARSNRYGQQISMLIEESRNVNAFPLYAFYSGSKLPNSCGSGESGNSSGILICGAELVDSELVATRARVDVTDASKYSVPLACLACCPMTADSSAKSLIGHLERYFGPSVSTNGGPLGLDDQLSGAIRSVVDNDCRFPVWWENEFAFRYRNVGALMIVDQRGAAAERG